MTDKKRKNGAMLKYLCILFVAAALIVTLSLVVRQNSVAAADRPAEESEQTEQF